MFNMAKTIRRQYSISCNINCKSSTYQFYICRPMFWKILEPTFPSEPHGRPGKLEKTSIQGQRSSVVARRGGVSSKAILWRCEAPGLYVDVVTQTLGICENSELYNNRMNFTLHKAKTNKNSKSLTWGFSLQCYLQLWWNWKKLQSNKKGNCSLPWNSKEYFSHLLTLKI